MNDKRVPIDNITNFDRVIVGGFSQRYDAAMQAFEQARKEAVLPEAPASELDSLKGRQPGNGDSFSGEISLT